MQERENKTDVESESRAPEPGSSKPTAVETDKTPETPFVPAAAPSAFARTLFGLPSALSMDIDHSPLQKDSSHPLHTFNLTLPYPPVTDTGADPFAGPSPDDIVLQAQKSKGPARGARKN